MRVVKIPVKTVGKPKKRVSRGYYLLLLMSVIGLMLFQYFRPLPPPVVSYNLPDIPAPKPVDLAWPATGQASISAQGYSFTSTNAKPTQISTASIAKVITVLCVLQKHPLKIGQQGPVITMSDADVTRLDAEINRNGTHLDIVKGEKITQYQAMEAIMLPSANNIADTLAVWSFGSLEQYRAYAQDFVRKNGMTHTVIGADASGYDVDTKSTTQDLAILAKLALANPVLMKIAGEQSATFETAGTVYNHNRLVGDNVMIGIKTGLNDGNSGGFLYAARRGNTTLTGAILDAGTMSEALNSSKRLAESAFDEFEKVKYIKAGTTVGELKTPWGENIGIVTAKDLDVTRWKAERIYPATESETHYVFGDNAMKTGMVHVRTDGDKADSETQTIKGLDGPDLLWRLTRLR